MEKLSLSRKYIETIPLSMGLMKSYIRKVCEAEFSFSKFRIIALTQSGKSTVSEIAEMMHISRPAVSKLVESLVTDKYLLRHTDEEDRRVIHLTATTKGKKKFQKVRHLASQMFIENLEGLNPLEIKELSQALSILENFVLQAQEKKV
ncbi:MarR family winged helix-turn-helix transcriptional regulator [Bacteriovorax sp. DB6_IX]|uniref:MarR family winged helix-turn-helix transcriptional regulator n=1 Tax=Bacteriovorax sp. DB6_IX TaxID=1353530 RepID=UPI00038A2E56|nr:MarR family transcriptional regulator [Bacteriovorax sp. DB6_IX]EQC51302.1 MarR family protein [Bacteriovorax sp. DB6_IX]